jgi:small subunit ribosomal protein S19
MLLFFRTRSKIPFFDFSLLQAIKADVAKQGVYTQSRSSTIIPAFVGAKIFIHRGNSYVPIIIQEEFVGKKLGQLVSSYTYALGVFHSELIFVQVETTKPWSFRKTNAHKSGAK